MNSGCAAWVGHAALLHAETPQHSQHADAACMLHSAESMHAACMAQLTACVAVATASTEKDPAQGYPSMISVMYGYQHAVVTQ
jgi:hypothetical protein